MLPPLPSIDTVLVSHLRRVEAVVQEEREKMWTQPFKKITLISSAPQNQEIRSISLGPRLGSTGAIVSLGKDEMNQPIAVKRVKVSTLLAYTNPLMNREFERAQEIERQVPRLIPIHSFLGAPYPVKTTQFTEQFLVMEAKDGSLATLVEKCAEWKSPIIKWEFLRKVAHQCLRLIEKLHLSTRMIHRDIKPDNFLFSLSDGTLQIFLADFGVATFDKMLVANEMVGTPIYAAREQLSPVKDNHRRASWRWDVEGWVLSLVGMAADLGLIEAPPFLNPSLTRAERHPLKVSFFAEGLPGTPLHRIIYRIDELFTSRPKMEDAFSIYQIFYRDVEEF